MQRSIAAQPEAETVAPPAAAAPSLCPWCGGLLHLKHLCLWWENLFRSWGPSDLVPKVECIAEKDAQRTIRDWMGVLDVLVDSFCLSHAEVFDYNNRAISVASEIQRKAASSAADADPVWLVLMDGKGVLTYLILSELQKRGVPLDRVRVYLIDVDARMHDYHKAVLPTEFHCHNWDIFTWLKHTNLPKAVVYFNFSKLALGITQAHAAPAGCRGLIKTLNDAGTQLDNVCAFAKAAPLSTVMVSFPTFRGTGKDADGVSQQDRLFNDAMMKRNGLTSAEVSRRGKFVTFHVTSAAEALPVGTPSVNRDRIRSELDFSSAAEDYALAATTERDTLQRARLLDYGAESLQRAGRHSEVITVVDGALTLLTSSDADDKPHLAARRASLLLKKGRANFYLGMADDAVRFYDEAMSTLSNHVGLARTALRDPSLNTVFSFKVDALHMLATRELKAFHENRSLEVLESALRHYDAALELITSSPDPRIPLIKVDQAMALLAYNSAKNKQHEAAVARSQLLEALSGWTGEKPQQDDWRYEKIALVLAESVIAAEIQYFGCDTHRQVTKVYNKYNGWRSPKEAYQRHRDVVVDWSKLGLCASHEQDAHACPICCFPCANATEMHQHIVNNHGAPNESGEASALSTAIFVYFAVDELKQQSHAMVLPSSVSEALARELKSDGYFTVWNFSADLELESQVLAVLNCARENQGPIAGQGSSAVVRRIRTGGTSPAVFALRIDECPTHNPKVPGGPRHIRLLANACAKQPTGRLDQNLFCIPYCGRWAWKSANGRSLTFASTDGFDPVWVEVMPFVEDAQPLNRFTIANFDVAEETCDAIKHSQLALAAAGLAHGDLKPENIFVGRSDAGITATFIDWTSLCACDAPDIISPDTIPLMSTPQYYESGRDSGSKRDVYAVKAMAAQLFVRASLSLMATTEAKDVHPTITDAYENWCSTDAGVEQVEPLSFSPQSDENLEARFFLLRFARQPKWDGGNAEKPLPYKDLLPFLAALPPKPTTNTLLQKLVLEELRRTTADAPDLLLDFYLRRGVMHRTYESLAFSTHSTVQTSNPSQALAQDCLLSFASALVRTIPISTDRATEVIGRYIQVPPNPASFQVLPLLERFWRFEQDHKVYLRKVAADAQSLIPSKIIVQYKLPEGAVAGEREYAEADFLYRFGVLANDAVSPDCVEVIDCVPQPGDAAYASGWCVDQPMVLASQALDTPKRKVKPVQLWAVELYDSQLDTVTAHEDLHINATATANALESGITYAPLDFKFDGASEVNLIREDFAQRCPYIRSFRADDISLGDLMFAMENLAGCKLFSFKATVSPSLAANTLQGLAAECRLTQCSDFVDIRNATPTTVPAEDPRENEESIASRDEPASDDGISVVTEGVKSDATAEDMVDTSPFNSFLEDLWVICDNARAALPRCTCDDLCPCASCIRVCEQAWIVVGWAIQCRGSTPPSDPIPTPESTDEAISVAFEDEEVRKRAAETRGVGDGEALDDPARSWRSLVGTKTDKALLAAILKDLFTPEIFANPPQNSRPLSPSAVPFQDEKVTTHVVAVLNFFEGRMASGYIADGRLVTSLTMARSRATSNGFAAPRLVIRYPQWSSCDADRFLTFGYSVAIPINDVLSHDQVFLEVPKTLLTKLAKPVSAQYQDQLFQGLASVVAEHGLQTGVKNPWVALSFIQGHRDVYAIWGSATKVDHGPPVLENEMDALGIAGSLCLYLGGTDAADVVRHIVYRQQDKRADALKLPPLLHMLQDELIRKAVYNQVSHFLTCTHPQVGALPTASDAA